MKNNYQIVYIREQKRYSLALWIFLYLCGIGIPWLICHSVSPNHYWHF